MVPLDPGTVSLPLKAAEDEFGELLDQPGAVPAPCLARAGWVALEHPDAMPPAELKRLTERSWRLVPSPLP